MSADDIMPEDIGPGFVARPRPTVASVELDGEAVLYEEASGQMHTLDRIATVVWSCMDGASTLGDIAGELAAAFGAQPEVVEGDVVALARRLGGQGVLDGVVADPSTWHEREPDEEQAR